MISMTALKGLLSNQCTCLFCIYKTVNLVFYRLVPADQYSSSSSSCRSVAASPLIFSNALHVAVDHGAVEVARLLLKYGLEPDQGGRVPCEPPPSPRHHPQAPQPPSRPCSPTPLLEVDTSPSPAQGVYETSCGSRNPSNARAFQGRSLTLPVIYKFYCNLPFQT